MWTFGELIRCAARTAGFTGEQVVVAPSRLIELGVGPWIGLRSLPLWMPEPMIGLMRPATAGTWHLAWRIGSLPDIMRDTLTDEIARGLTRPRQSGLSRDQELEVLGRV